jgi:23S rRNA (uracil1939-C5)-methyltransferase
MTVTLKIDKNVYGGDGLGRLGDGRVCFVPGVFAGETVRAELLEQKKSFVRARCVELVEASADRIRKPGEAVASGFASVPGMVYSDVNYAAELRFKAGQLGNFLERIGQSYAHVEVVAGKSLNYRNKVTYHLQQSAGKWLIGYRKEHSHDVVDIVSDPLARKEINDALPSIRSGVLSMLTQGARNIRREARESSSVTVRWTLDDGVHWWLGKPPEGLSLVERTCGLKFNVAAGGFYQVNPEIGEKLVRAVVDAYADGVDVSPDIVDLYRGVGVFGLSCVNGVRGRGLPAQPRIVGIESGRRAVSDAKVNAKAAGIEASFFCDRVGGSLRRLRIGERSTVVVDPPRGGMEHNVPAFLAGSKASRIFYVSCDPATLARDLQSLVKSYRIKRVRLFDMFPRTARFETLVELEK